MLPPGDYRVVTDEEVIEGLSFTAYHRISTEIFVPAEAGCAVEMITIDPMDLQAAHEQDVAMLAVHYVVGRPTNTAASWAQVDEVGQSNWTADFRPAPIEDYCNDRSPLHQ